MLEELMQPIQLPSKFLPYDRKEFYMRTFVGADEKYLVSITYDNMERKFADILSRVSKGIDPKDLTIGDRLYCLIWQAIHSYTKDYEVQGVCEHCFETFTTTVDLSSMEVKELPDGYSEPKEVQLPVSKEAVKLRLFRVRDEIEIADYEKVHGESWLYRYALSMVDSRNVMERVRFLEKLPVKDLAIIRAFHEEYRHGPTMEVTYVCPKCGESGVMPVPFRLDLFLPSGKAVARSLGDRV